MAAFTGIQDVVDAELAGRVRDFKFRKNPTQVTTAGIWFDLANAGGNPPAKQWFDATPLTATQVKQSTDKGLFHGANVSPSEAYLRRTLILSTSATPLPMQMILCDYLLYYPTVEDGTTDPQVMDNTNTLPRYTDGEGVQMIAITTGARTGGDTFRVTYTNSDGVAGRQSVLVTQNTSSIIGTITNSALTGTVNSAGPFIGLQAGDTGVRSVESVQMTNGTDSGFFTIVLVKPIAETQIRGIDAPVEVDYLMQRAEMPRIYDDAFLGFLCLPNGSLNGVGIIGGVKLIWN